MNEAAAQPELPNIISLVAGLFKDTAFAKFLIFWESVIFSIFAACVILILAYIACRKRKMIPGRLQNVAEIYVSSIEELVCGIIGPKGKKYTAFIGTLFIYIIFMNFLGLVPLFKSSTANLSTTIALSLCVFVYVQYTALKELGLFGYIDHLAAKPRGGLALSIVMPVLIFAVHLLSELIKPLILSLRLYGNIWGDDVLIAVVSGFGIGWLPILFIGTMLAVLTAVVQAVVFCMLSTVYFALVMAEE